MTVGYQSSLFDALTEFRGPELGPLAGAVRRHVLSPGAWVDVRPAWVTGAEELFVRLVNDVPWHAERRQMYDRVVDVPRLLKFYGAADELPDPLLAQARDRLSAHYAAELPEGFATAGMCYYRDGRDSVAWHGDTIGRGSTHDTMVAIVSVGDPRRLALRPRGGGESISVEMGHGDLVVMGGSCQRTWEHAVPKVASAGPRVSVQFRPFNVF